MRNEVSGYSWFKSIFYWGLHVYHPKHNTYLKTFRHNTDRKTAFNACKKALTDLECNISLASFEQGDIEAKKPGGLLSYGNKITIEVNSTELHVISDTLGIQLIDWGTNTENEDKIIQSIAKLLK
jgi:hypothetical protein